MFSEKNIYRKDILNTVLELPLNSSQGLKSRSTEQTVLAVSGQYAFNYST